MQLNVKKYKLVNIIKRKDLSFWLLRFNSKTNRPIGKILSPLEPYIIPEQRFQNIFKQVSNPCENIGNVTQVFKKSLYRVRCRNY